MKTLYLDCGMGAAGDMLAAALLELLPDPAAFVETLRGLGLPGVGFTLEKSVKCGVTGSHLAVTVAGKEEGEEHPHSHDHHGHSHEHRNLHDIRHLVEDHLQLPEAVRGDILAVYDRIAQAESRVHGVPVENIHFHEVGTLDAVADILKQDPEYLHLLSIPSIPKKERCALLDEAFRGKVHLYVLNFVKILCEKGTLRELPGCARAFRVKYNQAHGILEATAVTAVPMSADQTARLHEKLEAVTGKTIDLRTKVDAAVLGGIRLDIEGTELDGTVKNRLASLRRSIAGITV